MSDDFVRTVGERSLSKLYEEAVTLISKGMLRSNVLKLKLTINTLHIVLMPLSSQNEVYNKLYSLAQRRWHEAQEKEGRLPPAVPSPESYDILVNWFSELNNVIDDNHLLFTANLTYQEGRDEYD